MPAALRAFLCSSMRPGLVFRFSTPCRVALTSKMYLGMNPPPFTVAYWHSPLHNMDIRNKHAGQRLVELQCHDHLNSQNVRSVSISFFFLGIKSVILTEPRLV